MRALFSGHLLCSPLVALFCCYLIHSIQGSNLPQLPTSGPRRSSSARVVSTSNQHNSLSSEHSDTATQRFSASGSVVHSVHKSMETKERPVFYLHSSLSEAARQGDASRSFPLLPPPRHPGSDFPTANVPHGIRQSRTAYMAKRAHHIRAKEYQRQQADRSIPRHLACTQTRFTKSTGTFLNIQDFSLNPSEPLVSPQSNQLPLTSTIRSHVIDSGLHETKVNEKTRTERKAGFRRLTRFHRIHRRGAYKGEGCTIDQNNNHMTSHIKFPESMQPTENVMKDNHKSISHRDVHVGGSESVVQNSDIVGSHREKGTDSAGRTLAYRYLSDNTVPNVNEEKAVYPNNKRHGTLSAQHRDYAQFSLSRKRRHSQTYYLTHRHTLSTDCGHGQCPPSIVKARSARDLSLAGTPRGSDIPSRTSVGGMRESGRPDQDSEMHPPGPEQDDWAGSSFFSPPHTYSRFGNAVYFSGREVLRLKPSAQVFPGKELPAHHFTVEMWVKPEGGQYEPAIIAALTGSCGGLSPGGYWTLGIRTSQDLGMSGGAAPPTDARFFFSLKTARATKSTTVRAHTRYRPLVWSHLAASYDGQQMALYVNGALLAVGQEQSREIFPRASAASCKVLTLGGLPPNAASNAADVVSSFSSSHFPASSLFSSGPLPQRATFSFRGSVDEVRLWQRALKHSEIKERVQAVMASTQLPFPALPPLPRSDDRRPGLGVAIRDWNRTSSGVVVSVPGPPVSSPDLYLYDDLHNLSRWSDEEGRFRVRLIISDLTLRPDGLSIAVPRCGQTMCDNPEVVLSYSRHGQLRSTKQVRYRVVNLMNDNGSNPTVSKAQIRKQHKFLNRAFKPYNITFQLNVHEVRNSTLRQRLIMFGCELERIGDGICNQECMHTQTGQDGGDCDTNHTVCSAHRKGNGRCDFECNKHYHDWDDGDCCLPGNNTPYTCYDPHSPHRAYVLVEELRQMVALRGDTHLNVFIAVFSDWSTQHLKATHLIGLATFPWEKHVYSVQGGAVIQQQTFGSAGQMDSLVHEVGHILGLWHVHHGVSEVECSDPCAEKEASMLVGDLCSDTAPTSHNVHCRDPGQAEDHCGLPTDFRHTPYRNYMSYADDNCTDHFTEQQVARMHCYLDLVYLPWRKAHTMSPVPLPPKVVAANDNSVTVAWLPPLGGGAVRSRPGSGSESLCGLCDKRGSLVQFAARASSPSPSVGWSPDQATGRPDAEPCVPSTRAWLPEVELLCSKKTPCRLDLMLHVPVVARTLTLWVTWHADGIRRLRLVFQDGSTSVLKAAPAHCDMPLTITLNDTRPLHKVQVYTRTPFTAIDAMQVVSAPGHSSCQSCQPITYRVFRSPAFRNDDFRFSRQTKFIDREVQKGTRYVFWVVSEHENRTGQPSPSLRYTHGQHFCGDGHVDSDDGEQCDDGNLLSGDGCDVKCHVEESFHCKDSPSLCYRHDGDGVCEEFERESSVLDCGFYTPPHHLDQWAHDALANPNHQLPLCPARLATGPPDRSQRCGPIVDPRTAWFPCGAVFETGNFWIELYIARPVVVTAVLVHVAADGRTEADPDPKTLTLRLIKEDNSTELLMPGPVTLDCQQAQMYIPVVHDLSKAFFKSRGVRLSFRSANVSISAVRVRSYRFLDPVTLASCGSQDVYNPHTGICLTRNCSRAPCPAPTIRRGRTLCTGQAEGDVCTVTCDAGYRPQSPTMEMVCRGGHWLPSQPVLCLPVDCGRPALPKAVVSCQQGTSYGQRCSFRCQGPSSLHGSDNEIVCEEDGLWSTPRAQCLVTCPPPLHVQHVRTRKKRCRSGSLVVGSRCKMRCKKGYHVAGSRRANRRVFRLTCQADGTWSGSHCQKVTCPKFDSIFTGLISCTDDVRVASRCTLMCPNSDEAQIVTCNAEGQWNAPLRRCRHFDNVVCPDTDDVTELILRCPRPVVGAQCAVSCPTSDDAAMFSFRRAGRRSAGWEIVHSITCTGRGEWFPPLDRITCVEQCNKEFIGDMWCDARNNRGYCQWDGGDCCQSTLGAKVEPFSSCGEACACKDPEAIENQGAQVHSPDDSGRWHG